MLRLSVTDPLPQLVEALNEFQPDNPAVATEVTESLERTPAGKLKLVVREPSRLPP